MANSKQQKALTLMILAALTMAVGCGDGRRHKYPLNRLASPNGKATPANKGDKTAGVPAGTADTPAAPATTPNAEDAAAEKQIQTWLDDQTRAKEGDSQILTADLAEGTYTLETVATQVKAIDGNSQAQAFLLSNVQAGAKGYTLQASGQEASVGMLANSTDNGRAIEIPLTFNVHKDGGVWKPSRDEASDVTLRTSMVQQGVDKLGMVDRFEQVSVAVPAASALLDMLSGQAMQNNNSSSDRYLQSADVDGKALYLRLLKLSDGRVRFYVTVDEKTVAQTNTETPTSGLTRNIVLTYRFEAKAADTANTANDKATTGDTAKTAADEADTQADSQQ